MEFRFMRTPVLLALALLIASPGLPVNAATPEPAVQESGKPKPRKSKRLAPPCPDQPSGQPGSGKKKSG
jgi:hypothetical protein